MPMVLEYILAIIVIVWAGLFIWRRSDHRADRVEMHRLVVLQPTNPPRFTAAMVADLPEPARRFFAFAIAENTLLYTVAKLEMEGKFGMGDKIAPRYLPMRATQVLAAPHGFVWKMSGGTGAMWMSGSDSARWTRFWIGGLAPVARLGGTPDHTRSAFGRYVAEALFWTPAAVLPGPDVEWERLSENVARMTMRHKGLEQAVDLAVGKDGRPLHVTFMRWSDANPDKIYRLQRFGGSLSEFREFDGFLLPTHVEAGNHFGTDEYFPFFLADISQITYPR